MKEPEVRYCINLVGTRLYYHTDGFGIGIVWHPWGHATKIACWYREHANVEVEILTDDEYFERLANDERMKALKERMVSKKC